MRNTTRVSGIAIVTALILMGAGCMSPATPAPSNTVPAPTPAPEPTPEPMVPPPSTEPTTQPESGSSGTGPVTGYEDEVSDPSQNY